MTTDAERDLTTIGCLAAHLQKSVRVIELACVELNVAPALRLNGVPYFNGQQVERLTARLADPRPLPEMVDPHWMLPDLWPRR